MAIWQFDCYIIPKINVEKNFYLDSDDILSWGKQSISVEKVDFLEKQTSWTTDIVQYGKDDETCIQFLYEDGWVEEVSCRLDLRSLSKEMLQKILDYINEVDGMIFYKNKIYPPKMEEIVELMKKSNANRFCQNPRKYFEEISNE